MRSQFSGYFDPSAEDLDGLWRDGLIALDTNVLLGLYRMPAASRKEVFDLLTQLRRRLWVPYHVLVEFHRNRLEAMRAEFSSTKQFGKDARNAYDAFKSLVSGKRIQERACWPELSEKLQELNAKAEELFKVAQSESDHYVSPNEPDSVLAFVDGLLAGRIGDRPLDQAAVDEAEAAARDRYIVKMGPGYLDQEKAGDFYMFDGLKYDRQYGDYMVWRELLAHSQEQGVTRLLLVTSDVKPDWWLDSKSISGKRPQPELVMEMRRVADVQCFWMYTLSDFIQSAKHHLHAQITQKTILDARQAETLPRRDTSLPTDSSRRRVRAITKSDIETVLRAYSRRSIVAGPYFGSGFSASEPDSAGQHRETAVLVISGDLLLSRSRQLRAEIKETLTLMSIFERLAGVEVYVLFPSDPPIDSYAGAYREARAILTDANLKDIDFEITVGHFLNEERTDFVFES